MRAANLAGVVVADGPGSFTGLRIGVAFAKGLCRAAGLPLLALPVLGGLALEDHGVDAGQLLGRFQRFGAVLPGRVGQGQHA